MPFSQYLLIKFPSVILMFIFVGTAVLLAFFGLIIVRRLIPHHKLKTHNDVSGPIFSTLGVVYAVLLAFVVIIVWENYDRTNISIDKEAACLTSLKRDLESFSPDFKIKMQTLLKEYAHTVINDEWKELSKGKGSQKVEGVLKDMWALYSSYAPRSAVETIFLEESVRKLNELGESRSMRIIDSKTGIHPIIWMVLILGGITTIVFTFFFGAENLRVQMLMSIALAILISLILFTVFSLDFPFTGDVRASPDAFNLIFSYD